MATNTVDLRKQLDRLMAEKTSLTDKRKNADQRLSAIGEEIKNINAALSVAEPTLPLITDHALVRYLERKYSLDLEAVKAEILPHDANLIRSIQTLGDGKYAVGSSHRITIKGNTVTTVLPLVDDRK